MKRRWIRTSLVIFGAIIVTALSIDAADTLRGSDGTLLSRVLPESGSLCPKGMSVIAHHASISCADTYEASPSGKCPVATPGSLVHTQQNVGNGSCVAESKGAVEPWRFITREQAMQVCARAGKRLPTSEEWYALALGIAGSDGACNVSSGELKKTGETTSCASPQGVYDLVGNLWEWVNDDVFNGNYKERPLPDSGYVVQVDAGGMATVATTSEIDLFEKDYFWAKREGVFGIIRGGFFDSGSDAGIYTAHADTPPTSAGAAIGFRCVI